MGLHEVFHRQCEPDSAGSYNGLGIHAKSLPCCFLANFLKEIKISPGKNMGGHLKDGTDSRNPRIARRDHYEKLNLKDKIEICQPITH
jgi:hypothetical protein